MTTVMQNIKVTKPAAYANIVKLLKDFKDPRVQAVLPRLRNPLKEHIMEIVSDVESADDLHEGQIVVLHSAATALRNIAIKNGYKG